MEATQYSNRNNTSGISKLYSTQKGSNLFNTIILLHNDTHSVPNMLLTVVTVVYLQRVDFSYFVEFNIMNSLFWACLCPTPFPPIKKELSHLNSEHPFLPNHRPASVHFSFPLFHYHLVFFFLFINELWPFTHLSLHRIYYCRNRIVHFEFMYYSELLNSYFSYSQIRNFPAFCLSFLTKLLLTISWVRVLHNSLSRKRYGKLE